MTTGEHEVVICGAGASGLSAAAMPRKRGVEGLVLERSDRIAPSWRSRFGDLRLNTLGWMSRLPGLRPSWGPRHFPPRDRCTTQLLRDSDLPPVERSGVELKGKREAVRLYAPERQGDGPAPQESSA